MHSPSFPPPSLKFQIPPTALQTPFSLFRARTGSLAGERWLDPAKDTRGGCQSRSLTIKFFMCSQHMKRDNSLFFFSSFFKYCSYVLCNINTPISCKFFF